MSSDPPTGGRAAPPADDDRTRGSSGPEPAGERIPGLPGRYQDPTRIGSGGFGQVWQVWDRRLERRVAIKFLRSDLVPSREARWRFLTEIRVAARLRHPHILALFDSGEFPDHRLWFTMPLIAGQTFEERVAAAHARREALPDARVPAGDLPAPILELLEQFERICTTMAYVHERGVIHRDLKPSNVMVEQGDHVLIVDWGLARESGRDAPVPNDGGEPRRVEEVGEGRTRPGLAMGTLAYMPAEQRHGRPELHGPASDVYALGGILYHLLSGAHPRPGGDAADGPRGEPSASLLEGAAGYAVPLPLLAIQRRARAEDVAARYPDAGSLARDVQEWLARARRRRRGLEQLAVWQRTGAAFPARRQEATERRRAAHRLLDALRLTDPVEDKLPGWELQDEAAALERQVTLDETRWVQGVHGVLSIDPTLSEAHRALMDHYRRALLAAERGRRPEEAARTEELYRAHRQRWREGGSPAQVGLSYRESIERGALTLVTDPPGAEVQAYRYVARRRRLVPVAAPELELGPTPICEVELPHGSYLLRLRAPGRVEVRYPVLIERGVHWDGVPPQAARPAPVYLPRAGELHADEVYVPCGYALLGGDPVVPEGLPAARVWIAGFAMGRFPVTHAEYLAFLNALLEAGRGDEAEEACPRVNRGASGPEGALLYPRDARGRFGLPADPALGGGWSEDSPAVSMSWYSARAYLGWLDGRRGVAHRLPNELEREKAVRGVDGRRYSWGDFGEPTYAVTGDSFAGTPVRRPVGEVATDESPYGLRGGCGNVRDWCGNLWTHEGPRVESGRLLHEEAPADDPGFRSVRGGSWLASGVYCRAAARLVSNPERWWSTTGLRIFRPLGR